MFFAKSGSVTIKNETLIIEMDQVFSIKFYFKRKPELLPQLEHYLEIYDVYHLPTLFNLKKWALRRNLAQHSEIKGWIKPAAIHIRLFALLYSSFGYMLPIRKK
jgi:hypothetical protein